MEKSNWLSFESDGFIGRRTRFKRYLVSSLDGYFPVLLKTGEKSLAVVYRTGGAHVSMTGTLAVATSSDGGKSWGDGVLVQPRWDDVRNPAFGVNSNNELVVVYKKASVQQLYEETANGPQRPRDRDWKINMLMNNPDNPSLFVSRSNDGGKTWEEGPAFGSELVAISSPYGRILTLEDGTMLMSVYGTLKLREKEYIDACTLMRSYDGGLTWGDSTMVAIGYNEASFAVMPDNRLIGVARSVSGHVAVVFSSDMGKTWTEPTQITRDREHPADITVLESGNLLMTFGKRIRPLGCGALISEDLGKTWITDREVMLAGDGIDDHDIGYPSTVQLKDGTIVTCMYFATGSEPGESQLFGWGRVTCQAIHYREEQLI